MTASLASRKAAYAGTFYPAEKSELEALVAKYIDSETEPIFEEVGGLIVPHAGYIYSGEVAGAGFAGIDAGRLCEFDTVTVFLLGPAHRIPVQGAAVSGVTEWETPLGSVHVSDISAKIAASTIGTVNDEAHAVEHSLEVQLPFLQKRLEKCTIEIVPILLTEADPDAIAEVILPFLGEDTLICVSTDLSHYLPYDTAKSIDRATIDSIKTFNFSGFSKENVACGSLPVVSAMHIARKKGWKFSEVIYKNSGDTTGDRNAVVGYVSILMGVEGYE